MAAKRKLTTPAGYKPRAFEADQRSQDLLFGEDFHGIARTIREKLPAIAEEVQLYPTVFSDGGWFHAGIVARLSDGADLVWCSPLECRAKTLREAIATLLVKVRTLPNLVELAHLLAR